MVYCIEFTNPRFRWLNWLTMMMMIAACRWILPFTLCFHSLYFFRSVLLSCSVSAIDKNNNTCSKYAPCSGGPHFCRSIFYRNEKCHGIYYLMEWLMVCLLFICIGVCWASFIENATRATEKVPLYANNNTIDSNRKFQVLVAAHHLRPNFIHFISFHFFLYVLVVVGVTTGRNKWV